MPSVVTAVCAAALVAASAAGRVPFAVVLFVVQAVLVVAWFATARLVKPGQLAGALVAIGGAVAADITLVRLRDHSQVRALVAVLAAVVGLAFVVQLARRDGRARLTAALAATVATGALVIAGAVLLGVRGGRGGADVLAVALVAVGVGMLPVQAHVPPWVSLPAGLAAGTVVGTFVAHRSSLVGGGAGGVVAVVAVALALAARAAISALVSLETTQTKSSAPATETASGAKPNLAAEPALAAPHRLLIGVSGAVPVLVVAPAVLVVARIMVG